MLQYPSAPPYCKTPSFYPSGDIPAVAVPGPAGSTSLDTPESSVISGIENRHHSKSVLVDLLTRAGLASEAEKVRRCGQEFWSLKCPRDHVHGAIPLDACGHKLCPDCSRRRQTRAQGRVLPALRELRRRYPHDRFVLLTLTEESSFEELKEIIPRFKKAFARLRRTVAWKSCIRGGIGSYEETFSPDYGWHFHAHLLLLRKRWWHQPDIVAAWERATRGRGKVVDIRKVWSLRRAADEVLKYIMKPSDIYSLGPDQVRQFSDLKHIKFSESYGELRGLGIESDEEVEPSLHVGDLCPTCGERLSAFVCSRSLLRGLIAENWVEESCHGPPDG